MTAMTQDIKIRDKPVNTIEDIQRLTDKIYRQQRVFKAVHDYIGKKLHKLNRTRKSRRRKFLY